jgi:hypothetical protein
MMEGAGHYERANGNSFKGAFLANKPHGKGVFKYADGTTHTGMFKNGRKHGIGYTTSNDGTAPIHGEWENGEQIKQEVPEVLEV